MKIKLLFGFLFVLLIVFFIADLAFGTIKIPFKTIIETLFSSSTNDYTTIIFDFRLPKAITAVFVGIALSISGLMMQTIFRNPLAGPYLLGISSGASLGVALLVMGFSGSFFISFAFMQYWSIAVAAWLGAALVLVLMLLVSLRIRHILTILIFGFLFSGVISAILNILQYFTNESLLKFFTIWTMGSIGAVTKSQLVFLIGGVSAGLILTILSIKLLNVFLLGEIYAQTLGVQVKTARLLVFAATSLLTGTVTAFCGPIGFIDIAVPHVARMFFKTADHKILVAACCLIGAIIMLISDLVSQLAPSGSLPINSITSLFGIPVIIWIIVKNQKSF